MDSLFVIPRIGNARLEDRLVDYDGPVLFTVRTENGGRYIAFLADEESEQSVYWLAPISDQKYSSLLRGAIEVRSAFAEMDLMEVRREHRSGAYLEATFLDRDEIDRHALPESGYRLTVTEADTALSAGFVESARVLAARIGRAVTRYVFDYGNDEHEAPARLVAKVILDTQHTVDAIAYAKEQEKKSGPIPLEFTRRTSLALRPIIASSLAIELVADETYDLFNKSIAGDSLGTLTELLEARGDHDKLRPVFSKLPQRALKWYKRLVEDLATTNANVTIEVGEPNRQHRVTLRRQDIPNMLLALSAVDSTITEDLVFLGELRGYDKDSAWFHIRDMAGPTDYRGRTTTSTAIEFSSRAQLSGQYAVHIVRFETYDPITDEPLVSYELVDINKT